MGLVVRRELRLSALLCMLTVFVMLATGCASSQESAIREQLPQQLARYQDAGEGNVRSLLGEAGAASIEGRGLDATQVYQAIMGNFSFELVDVTVDGDAAQAVLDVTATDMRAVVEGYRSSVEEWASSTDATETFDVYGQEGVDYQLVQMLWQALSAEELPTATSEVTLDLVRGEDGTWRLADEGQLRRMLFGGADLAGLLA